MLHDLNDIKWYMVYVMGLSVLRSIILFAQISFKISIRGSNNLRVPGSYIYWSLNFFFQVQEMCEHFNISALTIKTKK